MNIITSFYELIFTREIRDMSQYKSFKWIL